MLFPQSADWLEWMCSSPGSPSSTGSWSYYGYELLFRARATDEAFDGTKGSSATTQLLSNTLLSIGLDDLLAGKKAFVNFDREHLLGGLASILPPDILVPEVLESVEPDGEVISACEQLQISGYGIALDDFLNGPHYAALIPLITIIKVDFRLTDRGGQEHLLRTYQPFGIKMVAEKVETKEEFDWAWDAGCDFFPGLLLCPAHSYPRTADPGGQGSVPASVE